MTNTATLTKDQIAAIKWERKNKIQNAINYALAGLFMVPVVTFGYFTAQGRIQMRSTPAQVEIAVEARQVVLEGIQSAQLIDQQLN